MQNKLFRWLPWVLASSFSALGCGGGGGTDAGVVDAAADARLSGRDAETPRLDAPGLDECRVDNGGCDRNATCTDLPVGRSCACNAGFTGDGLRCMRNFIPYSTVDAYLKASNPGMRDGFGTSVAISADGNTLAVGAIGEATFRSGVDPGFDEGGPDAGAVYIYRRQATGWAIEAFIKSQNVDAGDLFGVSVALSADGSILAVGAPWEDSNTTGVDPAHNESATDSGAVYIYNRFGASWESWSFIKASNTGAGDNFGTSVALSGDGETLAVGASHEDGSGTRVNPAVDEGMSNAGAVYVYRLESSSWTFDAMFKASNPGTEDYFGANIALSGDGNMLAVGTTHEDTAGTGVDPASNEGASESGAVYVYMHNSGTWFYDAMIKASNAGAGDAFGVSLAFDSSGDLLAVGAYQEDSAGTGVGVMPNEGSVDSGAVYVFHRTGAWSETTFIKSSNTDTRDGFGWSLDFNADGTMLAVGALYEDGAGTGVNPTSDEGARDSGAAYLYRFTSGVWTHHAYLKANNTGAGDRFGMSLALNESGTVLVVGAPDEDGGSMGASPPSNEAASDSGAVYVLR